MRVPIALAFLLLAVASGSCASRTTGSVTDAGVTVDAGDSPSQGPASAKVVVIEFGDFECPYCGAEEPIVEQMLSDYSGRIRFVFKEFPLTSIHPYAELAAQAALAANAQGKFWPYHDLLYANQSALARSDLDSYASSLGLDMTEFDAALDNGTYASAVAADVAQGTSLGVDATPTFFVNGVEVVGAVPYSTLQGVINQQLGTK
jgi:protein-disulfide isomerase